MITDYLIITITAFGFIAIDLFKFVIMFIVIIVIVIVIELVFATITITDVLVIMTFIIVSQPWITLEKLLFVTIFSYPKEDTYPMPTVPN